jgi:hypothetical protein
MKPKCLTCNKQLSRKEAKYCTHHRDRSGKNNGSWKGGKPKCLICQKPLIHYFNKYCLLHIPHTFQRSKEGRKMVSNLMKGNQYRKGLLGNGWKGDKASYHPKHTWMKTHFGFPTKCEHCGKDGLTGRQIHWANIDHKYLRQRDNWLRLCVKCHGIYDKQHKLRLHGTKKSY